MSPPKPERPRPPPIRFRDLSKGWRLTLLAEWACLGWIGLSVIIVCINHRTGWPYPEDQYSTFYRALEIMLTKSILALGTATVIRFVCLERPRVRFPLGWSGVALAVFWVIFLGFASMPVY